MTPVELLHIGLLFLILIVLIGLFSLAIMIKDHFANCFQDEDSFEIPFDRRSEITAEMFMTHDYFKILSYNGLLFILHGMDDEEIKKLGGDINEIATNFIKNK